MQNTESSLSDIHKEITPEAPNIPVENRKSAVNDAESIKNFEKYIEIENLALVENATNFICPICFDECQRGQGVILHDCLHSFCRVCLSNLVRCSDDVMVKCPFRDNFYSCESHLQQREVKALVSEDIYEKYLQRSIITAEKLPERSETLPERSFHCKTPDCPGWCIYDNSINVFLCTVCSGVTEVNAESIKNFELHMESGNMALVKNTTNFTCPVCFDDFESGQGVVLHDCLHTFCRDCLSNLVRCSDDVLVKCPYRDDLYSCESHLQQREIKAIVSEDIYEKYLQRSIVTAEGLADGSFHCKTPDCPGWCIYDIENNVFDCPVCFHYNCLKCQAIHEGLKCWQYKAKMKLKQNMDKDSEMTSEFLNKLIEKGKALLCPKCDSIVMKEGGCDALKCSACMTEICWATKGPRWGPRGYGDTSGGCRCGVNGVKCHPSCKFCH